MQLAKITLEELEILISNGYNVSINTKSGIEKITDTYRKIATGRIITFADGSSIKCADKHLMWQDVWYYAKDFNIGDKIGEHQIVNIIELDSQCWIDFTVDAEHSSYIHNNITHHNSGKSYIIYLILKHIKKRTLIVVPTISLVHQLASDFIKYDTKAANWIHKIMAGADKNTKLPIVISTWQSLIDQDVEWFSQFDVVIGDECLSPDTLITMSDGNKKRIDEVMIGDVVKTYNEKTHIIEDKVVRTVFKNISENENMYEITLSNGNIINITGNHKVLLTNGEWKRADDLEISDIINSIE
jgi:intein/homing endonuclease